jgi:uncharacterized protein (TIGR01777 family)
VDGMKIVIAGGSGFIGKALVQHLSDRNEVVVLSRHPRAGLAAREAEWDGKSVGDWAVELEGAEAVINLSGASISKHWSQEYKLQILESRLDSTRAIGQAIAGCSIPPNVWINGSATGYYGNRGDELLNEDSAPGRKGEFLVDTCVAWEHEQERAQCSSTRKVRIRTGLVLGQGGGALAPLQTLARFFLGGAVGNGQQYMSWIHISDLVGLIQWILDSERVEGPVNGTAPEPERNDHFMAVLRAVLKRPWAPPVPAFVLRLVSAFGGPEASLLLDGQKVMPTKALQGGFHFKFLNLRDALADLLL